MRIHKAWYGPKGGHALLSSTEPGLQAVFRQAAWLTDLPGTLPSGQQWQPYFRTAIHADYFLLIHTRNSHDTTRAGMVDSVAAFIPLADLPLVPDFWKLAENLRLSHDSENRDPFVPFAETPSTQNFVHQPILIDMANSIVMMNHHPVIHVGQDGFDQIMLDLLQLVPRQLRREILFSLSFSPADAVTTEAAAVPKELVSRYPQTQLLPTSTTPPSLSVAAMLNMPAGQPLLNFGKEAAFDLPSAQSFILLEQAFRLWEKSSEVRDAVTLVRLLMAKSGDTDQARDIRNAALKRLISTSSQWTAADLLSMRNLQIERFDAGAFLETVETWVLKRAGQTAFTEDDFHLFSLASRGMAQQTWWNSRVHAGYVSSISKETAGINILAWTTIERFPESLAAIIELFQMEERLQVLSESIPPALVPDIADAVANESARRGAWQLCGAALAAAHAPSHALSKVLELNPTRESRRIAIESALSKASSVDRVSIAIDKDIEEITALAAISVSGDVKLLRKFDWSSAVWFDILDQVTTKRRNAVAEIPNRLSELHNLISRGERSERIWGTLARTGLADLSLVKNRRDAWGLIPTGVVAGVLDLTTQGWIASITNGNVDFDAIENPLHDEVVVALNDNMLMASLAKKHPTQFIKVIEKLYPQNDRECVALLDLLAGVPGYTFAPVPATALGRIIRDRYWTSAASRACRHGLSRDDFLPLCSECLSIVTLWDSIPMLLRIGKPVTIPTAEAWKMFEETLINLYPQGPMHNEIWSRSGGKEEKLDLEGSGIAQWHRGIKQIRAGHGPHASELLRVALRDYSNNPVLKILSDSHAIG